jgi:putative glycerol kinase 5
MHLAELTCLDVDFSDLKFALQLADQSAAMFGACCFNEGDVKLTMGTGSFLNINTGKTPMGSTLGN